MNFSEKRICKECGKEFEAKSPRQFYCKDDHYRPCPICGKPVFIKFFNDPPRCCSKACTVKLREQRCLELYGVVDPGNSPEAAAKRKKTCLERYGVDNPSKDARIKQKIVDAFRSKYGVDNISQNLNSKAKVKQTWKSKSASDLNAIAESRRKTCLERYGVDNPRKSDIIIQKTKDTLLHNYGVDCALKIPSAQEKVIATMNQRYGVDNAGQSEMIRNKAKETCIQRYGVPKYAMTEEFQVRYKEIMLNKYGVDNPMKLAEFQEKAKHTNLERYGVVAAFLTEDSLEKSRQSMLLNPTHRISKINKFWSDLFKSAGLESEFEYRLDNRWYDLHILNTKLLIEIDPTYSHSTQSNCWGSGIASDYHLMKSALADEKGYRCIHIFDWDDPSKILNMLAPKQRIIHGRQTRCVPISYQHASVFLNTYHLQNSLSHMEVCYGLVMDDELLAVMTFGKSRYSKKCDWELLRYACQSNCSITGGAEKLFNAFIKDFKPTSIISYCDLSKFQGDVYRKLGFRLDHKSRPSKIWSKDKKYITDNLLRQRGYDQIFNTNFGKGTSNEDLMIANGWRSVYDCGQAVYIYLKPEDLR